MKKISLWVPVLLLMVIATLVTGIVCVCLGIGPYHIKHELE